MNLNGQCEKAFNEWLENEYESKRICFPLYDYLLPCAHDMNFQSLPHEMQHGVKVKFFDSVGIIIDVCPLSSDSFLFRINSVTKGSRATRPVAETKAEQKANEIYNENN